MLDESFVSHVRRIGGHQHCYESERPNPFNLGLGIFMVFGACVAYGMQVITLLADARWLTDRS